MYELGYSVSEKELVSNIHEILNRGGAVFIAEVDSRVVGCICSVIDARVAEGIYGELVSLVVSEKFRGAGVGKGLVRIGEKWIAERAKKIRVRANSIRSEAHVFYENLGYKMCSQTFIRDSLSACRLIQRYR